ncbi:MAG TPA: carbohydrate kinase family protein [Candidatus Saccharimonadales bacterium]
MHKKYSAVAIGSCYLDINCPHYPFGASGIPAEVELVGDQYEAVPGGSAVNFCRLLSGLGLKPVFIGMSGTDPIASVLSQLLEEQGVHALFAARSDLSTNISFAMTSPEHQHIMLVSGTANPALNPDDILPKLREVIGDTDLLFMGGCFKLKAFEQSFATITQMAKEQGVKLVVDHNRIPKGTTDSMLAAVKELVLSADYYLPSRDEFCAFWQVTTIEEGLELLNREAPGLTVVVKDGANGAHYFENGTVQHVPAEVVSGKLQLTGAGDSFNGGVMAALENDKPLSEAVAYACQVAAAKISGQPLPKTAK